MSDYSVQISNISQNTTEQQLADFFSFCGKISKIDFNSVHPKTATIYFEKVSAAKTALMLNGGALDGSNLTVTSTVVRPDHEEPPAASGSGEHHHITQEDKPRTGIVAEYLAKGYVLGEPILQRAIDMDQKNGISQKFLSYLQSIDQTLGSKLSGPEPTLSQKAFNVTKGLDTKYGVSSRTTSYYQTALASPFGQKVWNFYSTTSKQVLDIHDEARRIAEAHKANGTTPQPAVAEPIPVPQEPVAGAGPSSTAV